MITVSINLRWQFVQLFVCEASPLSPWPRGGGGCVRLIQARIQVLSDLLNTGLVPTTPAFIICPRCQHPLIDLRERVIDRGGLAHPCLLMPLLHGCLFACPWERGRLHLHQAESNLITSFTASPWRRMRLWFYSWNMLLVLYVWTRSCVTYGSCSSAIYQGDIHSGSFGASN